MKWHAEKCIKNLKLRSPVLVEGLPGIGNVGKIAVDFLVEDLKAEKLCDFFSHTFPHTVFVNERSLVELPNISLYYKKLPKHGHDLLLLAGDIQPTEEVSCYEFCELVLDKLKELGGKEVITLGGIGLQSAPREPKVYSTGSSRKIVSKYCKGTKANPKLYGVVGPIVGVSGILVGLANRHKINGVSFLAETLGHPMHLDVKGAREILRILMKKLNLKVDIKKMEKEVEAIEKDAVKKASEIMQASERIAKNKLNKLPKEQSYIG